MPAGIYAVTCRSATFPICPDRLLSEKSYI